MKFRKHKITAFILAVIIVISLIITNTYATGYTAAICQGNTVDEGDCRDFFYWLKQVPNGNSYTIWNSGWQYNNGNSELLDYRATAQDLVDAGARDVLYWSGHGGRNPLRLNVSATNQSGIFTTFEVASTLQVNNSDWANTCVWKDTNLKVAIFAACYILDNTYDECKYLARAMKASNVRVIAGYHEASPTNPTDIDITNDFFSNANGGVSGGESIRSSWQTVNELNGVSANWAVLCYKSNYNQYYRIPGFPGNTYSAPASTASVYRFWCNYTDPTGGQIIPTSSLVNPQVMLTSGLANGQVIAAPSLNVEKALPLEIRIDDKLIDADYTSLKGSLTNKSGGDLFFAREMNDDVKTMLNEKTLQTHAEDFIKTAFDNKSLLSNSLKAVGTVKSEEISEETGAVPDTETTVGKTFCYNNQYNGILIEDSFIKVGTDSDGIYFVVNRWRDIESIGQKTTNNVTIISSAEAEEIMLGSTDASVVSSVKVYAPSPESEGVYRLCYKIKLSDGSTSYIDCETGAAHF